MNVKEWFKVYKWNVLILGTICSGTSFIGFLGARMVPIDSQKPPQRDTVYVGNGVTDSLLKDISVQVNEINRKIPAKKPLRRCKPKKDTLRIDASIHIDGK